VPIWWRIQLFE